MLDKKIDDMKKTLCEVKDHDDLEEYLWWCCNKSKMKISDFKKQKINFLNFKAGEIVYVTAGVNIGSEIKGGHYALVLKNSNKNSALINIVYLTSKDKGKYQYKLEKTIHDYVLQKIKDSISKSKIIGVKTCEKINEIKSKLECDIENFSEIDKELKQVEKELKHTDKEIDKICEQLEILKDKGDIISRKSYVNLNQVATVSKKRIKKHKNQILYKAMISDEELSTIIKKIKGSFFKNI